MFTAENWRNFPRLRLVLPIRPMTSFFTNFYFFGTPNIALLLGGSIGSWFCLIFFCPAGDLSTLGFLNGLFEIGLVSCCGTLQSLVTCLGHVDVSWIMVIRDLLKVGLHGMAKSSRLVRLQWRKSSRWVVWSLE